MTLYDIFMSTRYYQKFRVYDENAYDQHVSHGSGTRAQILNEDFCETGIDVLCNKVLRIRTCKDGALLVIVKADQYKKRCEKLYSKSFVATWDRHDKNTRPWRTTDEMEREVDAF